MNIATFLKTAQQKIVKPFAVVLALLVAIIPFLPKPELKYIGFGVLGALILRIVFEIESTVKKQISDLEVNFLKQYHELNGRTMSVQEILNTPNPPDWVDYTEAQPAILSTITDLLNKGEDIHLEILGVSARYSWRMVEDFMSPIIKNHDNRKFKVDVIVTTSKLLHDWSLFSWIEDLNRTVKGIDSFTKENKEEVINGRLIINRFNYDTLPQWHGVLINRRILFMGRTKWDYQQDGSPLLRVGQCIYRKFEPNDRYGGGPRIVMFINWIERLKKRSSELELLYKE